MNIRCIGKYYDNQKYDSAVIMGERALPLLRQQGMKKEEADELSILSVCCMRQSEYDKALQYAKACNQLDRESGDAERISSSLNTIGSIYVAAKQPQEAMRYLRQALQYAEKTGSNARIALTCGSLAETEFSQKHYDEAIRYIDRAIQLEREEGREAKLRVRLSQKATILVGTGKRQEAVEIFDSIIPYFRTTGNHQSLAISLNKAGQALLEMCHSGVDINKGRCSAVIPVWAILATIYNDYDFLVSSIHVGEANASIASSAEVIITIPSGEAAEFVKEQEALMNQWLRDEYGEQDPHIHCTIEVRAPRDCYQS